MGAYDDIDPKKLRVDLTRFAELILRLEEEGGLLTSPSDLLTIMGDLRQKLFAYEVRSSHLLESGRTQDESEVTSELEGESLRVVREARERNEEMLREWSDPPHGDENDDG